MRTRTIQSWLDGMQRYADDMDCPADIEAIKRQILAYVGGDPDTVATILDAPLNDDGYCVVAGHAYALANTDDGYQVVTWRLDVSDSVKDDMLDMIGEYELWFWEDWDKPKPPPLPYDKDEAAQAAFDAHGFLPWMEGWNG